MERAPEAEMRRRCARLGCVRKRYIISTRATSGQTAVLKGGGKISVSQKM